MLAQSSQNLAACVRQQACCCLYRFLARGVASSKTKVFELRDTLPEWEKRSVTLRKRFGHWNPTRRISRQRMQDMRDMAEAMPHMRTVDLAAVFRISPEAVRRILSSKWVPNEDEESSVLERAERFKERRKESFLVSEKQAKVIERRRQAAIPIEICETLPVLPKPSSSAYSKHSSKDIEPGRSKKAFSRKTKATPLSLPRFVGFVADLID